MPREEKFESNVNSQSITLRVIRLTLRISPGRADMNSFRAILLFMQGTVHHKRNMKRKHAEQGMAYQL